jgi:hypothetical protein
VCPDLQEVANILHSRLSVGVPEELQVENIWLIWCL